MVQELETFVEDIHSISVVCDNDVIFSKCIQPYTEEPMQMLHSFSKSMNSIAVGIAIDEGKLHLDDLVIDYFKEYLPEEYDKRIDQLTVRNLLTMAANSCRLSTCFRGVTDSWITHYFTYKLPHDPGTVFQYDTGASYMLSSLVTKTMHKNVLALMKERVLKPMGITDIEWLESPEGNTVGGWGLYLKTPDIAKIAILLANMGKWNGKTLIPEEYLKEATRKQIDTPEEKYPVCGYGYQYWITADHSFGVYGAFGNVIVVNPEKKLAVAITAGASDTNGNPNRLISKIVNEKLFIPTERGTLETDVDGEKKLKKYLEAEDVEVVLTRETEDGLYDAHASNKKVQDMKRRIEIIEKTDPVLTVSIHQNSYPEEYVHGAQVFYYTGSMGSETLASGIQDQLVRGLAPENHRKVKANDSYYLLKKTKGTIVIVECGFLSNQAEAEKLCDEEYQDRIAWLIHKGILRYLKQYLSILSYL